MHNDSWSCIHQDDASIPFCQFYQTCYNILDNYSHPLCWTSYWFGWTQMDTLVILQPPLSLCFGRTQNKFCCCYCQFFFSMLATSGWSRVYFHKICICKVYSHNCTHNCSFYSEKVTLSTRKYLKNHHCELQCCIFFKYEIWCWSTYREAMIY